MFTNQSTNRMKFWISRTLAYFLSILTLFKTTNAQQVFVNFHMGTLEKDQ